jgi:hypothetical protein
MASDARSLFGAPSDRAEAEKWVREVGNTCFLLAALHGVGAMFFGPAAAVDGAIYAGLGAWIRGRRSRVAVALLGVVGLGAVVFTVLNVMNGGRGGRNVWLAIVVCWSAVRGWRAASFLARPQPAQAHSQPQGRRAA